MEDLRRRTGRFGLDIILVNVWEGVNAIAEAQSFCDLWGVEGTVLLDEAGRVAEAFGLRGVPSNVFVDTDGRVVEFGASRPEDLEAAAARLLGIRPSAELTNTASSDWHWQKDQAHIERHISARKAQSDETA